MKKYKLKPKVKKYLIFIVFFVIILIVGIIIIKNIQYKKTSTFKLLENGYSEKEISTIKKYLNNDEISVLIESKYNKSIMRILDSKYFIKKNYQRYIDYHNNNIEIEIPIVIGIVNTNADKPWYNEIQNADTSKNELVLVNKFYKLNDNTEFDDLKQINLTYAYQGNKLRETALNSFLEMAKAASSEGLSLIASSSYRTYSTQEKSYKSYVNSHDTDYADKVSARPGHSDHQTGLALDISSLKSSINDFANTAEFEWLLANSYKYGYIMRYPEGKESITGFSYEPWHYRYVGLQAAKTIHDENITFDEYYSYYIEG